MELQSYITENTDYLSKFKEHKLYVRKNKQLGICIVKCHYDRTYDYKSNPWMKYCRGAVIDILKNKLVCIPPQKAVDTYLIDIPEMLYTPPNKVIGKLQDVIDNYSEEYTYEPLFDGTMVNMFYHNDEWMISTRCSILPRLEQIRLGWKPPILRAFRSLVTIPWRNGSASVPFT